VILQRSNSLTSLTSTAGVEDLGLNTKDGTNNEDYLRICLSCRQVLQRRYDQLCFKNTEKDEVFIYYEVNYFRIFLYILFCSIRELSKHEMNLLIFIQHIQQLLNLFSKNF